jgi:hypothetical protein
MKRTALALTLMVGFLFSFVVGMQTFEVAKANFLPAPAIIIYSPAPVIYTNTSLPLSVVVNILNNSPEIVRILYCVDENSNVTLTNLTRTDHVWFDPNKVGSEFHVTSILDNLAEGNHTLKVYSQDAYGHEMSSSVKFTIDTHYKYPEALILSPQNKTYTTTEVPLTWTCDEQIVSADYFLDPLLYGSTTLLGNTTLTGLSNGTHTITVYVFTERGQANSQTVHFTVSPEAQLQPEPFPATLVIAPIASVVVISVGLLVYFKKRNNARINKHNEIEQPST